MSTATAPARDRSRLLDVLGLLARLVLGGVILWAGLSKVTALETSAEAVRAYQLFSYDVAGVIGYVLPVVEVVLGALIVLGLFTRVSAAIGAALMLVFVAGIASAWARGLSIDCGCFGGGGALEPADATAKYPWEIARDLGLALCGAYLVARPRSLAALDRLIYPDHD